MNAQALPSTVLKDFATRLREFTSSFNLPVPYLDSPNRDDYKMPDYPKGSSGIL
jgi:hypothetical protein